MRALWARCFLSRRRIAVVCCIFVTTILAMMSTVVMVNRTSMTEAGTLYDVPGIWPISRNIMSAFNMPEYIKNTAINKVAVVVIMCFFMSFPKLYITIVILSKRCNYKHNDCRNRHLTRDTSVRISRNECCFNGIISCNARVYSCYRCSWAQSKKC